MAEIGILYREEGNRSRRGIRLRRQGLMEEHTLRRPRLIPWSEVVRVEWRARTIAQVITRNGTIRLDDRIERFPELVVSIDEHIRPAGLHTTVTPEGIEKRLGIKKGEVLMDDGRWAMWFARLIYGPCVAVFAALATVDIAFAVFALGTLIAWWLFERYIPVFVARADAYGVTVELRSESKRYAWSELEERPTQYGPSATLGGHSVGNGLLTAAPLKRTARAILAAQREPYAPPGPRPAPDMALSRAEAPEDVLVERGLSRSR